MVNLLILRLFVDKNIEFQDLEPILMQAKGLFRRIAFIVKPSLTKHLSYNAHNLSFIDYIYFANDSIHSKLIDQPCFRINTKNNAASDQIKSISKNGQSDHTHVKLLLKKGMDVQEYIEIKNSIYSRIDSLRDEYSVKKLGCKFDEIENKLERRAIIERYPKLVIIENEK